MNELFEPLTEQEQAEFDRDQSAYESHVLEQASWYAERFYDAN